MIRHKSSTARRLTLLTGVAAAVLAFGDVGFSPVRIAVPIGGGDGFTVDAVRLEGGLVRAAFAQSEITLENVAINAGPSVYRLPSVTFSGANLSRDELLGVLRGKGDGARHEALARISADSMTAPELIVEQTIDGEQSSIVYRNITASGIESGAIASIVIESTEVTSELEGEQVGGTIGETRVENLDLPFAVRWYADAAPEDGDNPFRTIYDSFSMADFAFGDEEAMMTVGLLSGDAVSMRLMREPLGDFLSELQDMSDGREPTDEETRRMLGRMADMMGSMQLGGFLVEDIAIAVPELGDEPVFSIESIAFGGDGGGMEIDAIRVNTEEAQVAIDAITSSGFDIEPMLAGLRRIADSPGTALDSATARTLLPTIGTWRLEGLVADVAPEEGAERIAVALGEFAMTAVEPVNGTPTDIRLSFDELAFALPRASDDDATTQLLALGYEEVDLSGVFAARWNEDASEVVIEEASVSGVEMGSVALSGAFGNLGPEAFAGDQTALMMAWLGATAKSVELSIVDEGLAERLLAMQADEQGVSAEALREQGAMMARGMLPAMLGGTPESRALGDALAAFVTQPGELDLVVTSTDPAGIPLMEFTMIENPMAFLPRVSIEAEAR